MSRCGRWPARRGGAGGRGCARMSGCGRWPARRVGAGGRGWVGVAAVRNLLAHTFNLTSPTRHRV